MLAKALSALVIVIIIVMGMVIAVIIMVVIARDAPKGALLLSIVIGKGIAIVIVKSPR